MVGLLAAGCGGGAPESTKGAAAESHELTLQPVGSPGPEPFTASSATGESAPVQPPLPNASGKGIRTVGAATPGLYGGTNRLGSCDVERQIGLLTSDDGKTRAFAEASGVEREKLPDFLRALTPVVLRADTRVTDHGFRAGRPAGYQAVLQAGTAVLVDDHGMPRVRCACGNPLSSPRGGKGNPVLKGDQWNGYQPNQVIVIEPTAQPIKNLVIVNVADNTWIDRRSGDDGAQDKPPRVVPPYDPADGIPDGPATQPDPADPCAGPDPNSLARTTPPGTPSAPPAAGLPAAGPPPADLPPADFPSGVAPPAAGPPAAGPPAADLPPADFPSGVAPPAAGPPAAGPPAADLPPADLPAAGPPAADRPSSGAASGDLPVGDLPQDVLSGDLFPLDVLPGNPASGGLLPGNPPAAGPPSGDAPSGDLPAAGPPAADGRPDAPSAPVTPCPSPTAPAPPRAQDQPQQPQQRPQPEQPGVPQDVPAAPPSDVPGDRSQDQPGQLPDDPAMTPYPDERTGPDTAVPDDPFGFPDPLHQSADSAPNLESA
ncbi:DUF6777 domain-containing protein [Streptomyces sp. NPDC087917]|uniref:DUF6777 domain-containing protein n=1 Tax=Streptomyces sp. NPDC087917 TaxID=3155060 RepID=UPI0034155D6F